MLMNTVFSGVVFPNPFVLASAPPTATGDMVRRALEAGWGGAVVKTLTSEPVQNLSNRFASIRSGGRITGFENIELLSEQTPEQWFQDIRTIKRDFPHCPVIASIMGPAALPDEWISLALGCQDAGADLLELNFSCPHGYPEKGRGAAIGQNPEYAVRIVEWLLGCRELRLPLIPKLTAAVADIRHVGEELAAAGASGFCAINSIPSFFGFDLRTLKPRPDVGGMTTYGGYSGAGIKPIALRAVSELCQSPGLPVMACGGVINGFDAAEFMLLGAPVVQVGTEVMLRGYGIVEGLLRDLEEFMSWHGFDSPADFIGHQRHVATSFSRLPLERGVSAAVVPDRCSGCSACLAACHDGGYQAIGWGDGRPVVDDAACVGCSLCSHVCPSGAMVMQVNDKSNHHSL